MISNIIFDVGKVLVSYDPDGYMKGLGLDEATRERVNAAMFRHPLWLDADQGLRSPEKFLQAFMEHDPEISETIRRVYESMGGTIELFDYAQEWISELKERGYHVYILSNYSEYMFRQTKHKLKFLPLVDDAVFSYTIKLIKPDTAIYRYLCDKFRLKPEECVFIDDRPENIDGAEKIGMRGICFQDYVKAKKDLENVINSF